MSENQSSPLAVWLSSEYLSCIPSEDQEWLARIFRRFNGYPALQALWQLMDEQWARLGCNPSFMDEDDRITQFYQHPVWLLNGLFIEQHEQSQRFRRQFTEWVASKSPSKVADYGGGFGSLARMIGKRCPDTQVDIIEPHPHPLAIRLAEGTPNVRYLPTFSQNYDILIATDVFEHVPDPLALTAQAATALKIGGSFLIANCFYPVIRCHLPQTFHFRYSWHKAMQAMGLTVREKVAYGQVFQRNGGVHLDLARQVEQRSQQLWSVSRLLPKVLASPFVEIGCNRLKLS